MIAHKRKKINGYENCVVDTLNASLHRHLRANLVLTGWIAFVSFPTLTVAYDTGCETVQTTHPEIRVMFLLLHTPLTFLNLSLKSIRFTLLLLFLTACFSISKLITEVHPIYAILAAVFDWAIPLNFKGVRKRGNTTPIPGCIILLLWGVRILGTQWCFAYHLTALTTATTVSAKAFTRKYWKYSSPPLVN